MLHITSAHCKRQGYRAIPTDATAAEERLADALLPSIEELEGMSRAEFNARDADYTQEEE